LREVYHGGPYVTEYLVSEAFNAPDGEAAIPACTLRERETGEPAPSRQATDV
jgi:hypothetical protein